MGLGLGASAAHGALQRYQREGPQLQQVDERRDEERVLLRGRGRG